MDHRRPELQTHTSWRSSSRLLNDCQLGLNFNLCSSDPNYLGENDEMPSHLRNWRFSSYFAPSPFAAAVGAIEGWTIAIVAKNSHPKGTSMPRHSQLLLWLLFSKEFIFMRLLLLHTMPSLSKSHKVQNYGWTESACWAELYRVTKM